MTTKDTDRPVKLKSLAPAFDGEQHQLYVDLICDQIDNHPETHNIAVTGAYGTGKSSVLEQLYSSAKYNRLVVRLSLSTVGDASDNESTGDSKTNLIQKEIVKQLLYRELPLRTPASRFRRAAKARRGREAWAVPIGALLIMAILVVTGVAKTLGTVLGTAAWQGWIAYGATFVLALTVVWVARRLTGGRLNVKEVHAGGASVSLADASDSYFDKYLDEIVYYFEVSSRTIVIFEDLDRFNDVHIFETLRSLNTILNGAKQLDGKPIRFIYALRDSLFEKLGADGDPGDDAAAAEVHRANRTKFFDMVVPIVPFITHENARDLMARTMKTTPNEISADLIDLVARHVAEMRLILNIRNEFAIFRRKLREGPYKVPGLDDDQLFAIVVYKNIHMADFERIALRRSSLDALYAGWRELIRQNVETLTAAEQAAARRLESDQRLTERAAALGARLRATTKLLTDGATNKRAAQFIVDGAFVDDRIDTPEFWRELLASGHELTIRLLPNNANADFSLKHKALAQFLGVTLDLDTWAATDAQETADKLERSRRDIEFVRHASWAKLAQRVDFVVDPAKIPGDAGPSARVPDDDAPTTAATFAELVAKRLASRLARDLVLAGYLTEYFTLQVSQFYGGRISENALNYVRHHLRPDIPDAQFALTPEDVDAIIHEEGASVLRDAGAYNIDIVDHLLGSAPADAAVVVSRLVSWGKPEKEFVAAYLGRGEHRRKLVELMTPTWAQAFTYLTSAAPVDEATRDDLVDAALTTWNVEGAYDLDEAVREWLQERCTELKTLKEPADLPTAEHAVALFARAGAALPDVSTLASYTIATLRHTPAYAITAGNLRYVSSSHDLALDVLRSKSKDVYRHVLTRLPEYLDAVDASTATKHTVADPAMFELVLADLPAELPLGIVAGIVERAHPGCRVQRLADVPRNLWPVLAIYRRTIPTVANVDDYLTEHGEIDGSLATLLTAAGTITPTEDDAEGARTRVAIAILNATATLSDPILRADLAHAADPVKPLAPGAVTPQPGPLVGLLLARGLLADDATTFTAPLVTEWTTRETAIGASAEFAEFMTPDLLPASDVPTLLDSPQVPSHVKTAVIASLVAYATGTKSPASLTRALVGQEAQLDYAQLMWLREIGAPAAGLVDLFSTATVSDTELLALLEGMGGNYALLAAYGTEWPVVPDDKAHRMLLDRLKRNGIVSSYRTIKHSRIRVFRRHSPQA